MERSFSDLRTLLPAELLESIIQANRDGDPDWLYDMIAELDTITPSVPHYLEFHKIMQANGIGSNDFNIDGLHDEIEVYKEWQDKQRLPDMTLEEANEYNQAIEYDNDINPAGTHNTTGD